MALMRARNDVWEEQERRRSKERQFQENRAREATTYITHETIGSGVEITEDPIPFDTPFLHEPSLATGVVLTRPPDDTYYKFPLVTAGVVRWERDPRGFYIGAFAFFNVRVDLIDDPPSDAPKAKPRIVHHLRFTGVSYKAVEKALELGDEELDPKLLPKVP